MIFISQKYKYDFILYLAKEKFTQKKFFIQSNWSLLNFLIEERVGTILKENNNTALI